jgi:hypothetical protein
MATRQKYDFISRANYTTVPDITFTVTVDGTLLDLTSAVILMHVRTNTISGNIVETLTSVDAANITISSVNTGEFTIKSRTLNYPNITETYGYDIKITLSSGAVKNYIYGSLPVVAVYTHA